MANNDNIIRQEFLYEKYNIENSPNYIGDFISNFLSEYKFLVKKKYPNSIDDRIIETKKKINTILDTFNERIEKRDKLVKNYINRTIQKFQFPAQYKELLEFTEKLTQIILNSFIFNLIKDSDMSNLLKEDFGFQKRSLVSAVIDLVNDVFKTTDSRFNKIDYRVEDIKEKSPLDNLYDKYKNKKPTTENFNNLKTEVGEQSSNTINEAKDLFNNLIRNIKDDFTDDKIKKFLTK